MAVHICETCQRKFESVESLTQHNQAKHFQQEKKVFSFKKYLIAGVLILALGIFTYSGYTIYSSPSEYDNFAKCLAEKGAVIYGNDFCQYTTRQLNMFDGSQKLLNYVRCISNEGLCNEKEVKITPTWYINGIKLEGVQTFERLAEKSGCVLA